MAVCWATICVGVMLTADGRQVCYMAVCWATICVGVMLTADGRQVSYMSLCWTTICVGVMLTALTQTVGNNDYAVHHSNTVWSNTTRCINTCLLNFQYRVDTYDDSVSRLLSAGDVQPNPGPVQYPCGICGKGVRRNQRGIACDMACRFHM